MLVNLGFLTIIDINIQKNNLQNNLFLLFDNKCKSIMLQEMLLLWLTQLQEI
jgi:hypothetical protein